MKKLGIYIVTLLILTSGSLYASKVVNVTLSHQDGFTVSHINVDGVVRFSHETEVAKDGKPFRVIVDVLAATHQLGAKVFTDLPACEVRGIRTSQYSVKPEKIVRIVYDMNKETVYRIDTDKNGIVLYFPDKTSKPFAAWSSKEVVAKMKNTPSNNKEQQITVAKQIPAPPKTEKTVKQINDEISKDHLASLEGPVTESPKPTQKQPPVAKKEKKTVVTSKSPAKPHNPPAPPTVTKPDVFAGKIPYGPYLDTQLLEPEPPKSEVVPEPKVKKQPAKKTKKLASVNKSTAAPSAPATPKVEKPVKPAKKEVVKAVAKPKTTVAKKQEPAKRNTKKQFVSKEPARKQQQTQVTKSKKQTKPTTTVASVAPTKEKNTKVKPKQKEQKQPPVKKPTSRFRRSPVSPTKIKGTLVAEFPKRLVIKYKPRGNDPFETLINESRTYNNPVERRIPNVEGIHLVGIIESDDGENSALFEDAEGYGYILKEGDKVRKGYVLRVESDRVYFQIFEYGWSRTLAMSMEEE